MSAPKHTPGPWRTDPECMDQCVLGPDGDLVADCAIFGLGGSGPPRTDDECTANARICAAGLDMLEALRELLSVDEAEHAPSERVEAAQAAARAAIRLAETGERAP